MDLLQMSIGEKVLIKMRFGRELRGRLIAYDEHLNIMVGEASEKVTDPETKIVSSAKQKRNLGSYFWLTLCILFCVGDRTNIGYNIRQRRSCCHDFTPTAFKVSKNLPFCLFKHSKRIFDPN